MTSKLIHSGNVYFFYRPKVEKETEVQRFFLVLYSLASHHYYLLVIGKKHFPAEKGNGYFAFLEAIKEKQNDLLQSLKDKNLFY